MSFSVHDFLGEAQSQSARDREQIARFAQLADDNRAKLRELQAGLQTALAELGAALLPHVDSISAASLADTLGMPEISRLWQRADARGDELDRLVAARDQSEEWRTRQTREIAAARVLDETQPLFAHAQQEWQRMADLSRMPELIERGWGTARYPHRSPLRFFNRQFLEDWRRADEAVEKMGVSDFAQAAEKYLERREQVQVLGRTVEEQQAILQGIQNLEAERAAWVRERQGLPDALRAQVAARVFNLLQSSPDLADRLPDAPTVRARVTALDGRQAQIRYLDGVQVQIERDRAEIEERAERLRQEAQRYESDTYRYRNKSFTSEQFGKRFGREGRYEKRWNRYHRTSTTVYAFRDYDRVTYYDAASDFLWWDVMTDGRLDGNFIPEVAEYRALHPDYHFERAPQSRDDFNSGFDTSDNLAASDFDLS